MESINSLDTWQTDSEVFPLAFGRVAGPITWFPMQEKPGWEVANARLYIPHCPLCGGDHLHGYRLDGERHESLKASHCARGSYRTIPSKGVYSPTQRMIRRAAE